MRPRKGGPRGHPNIISNGQRSSSSTATTPTPGPSLSQSQRKTTCLFCPKSVQLSNTSGGKLGKLEKSVRLLFKDLKIPSSELPQNFTREMFPFCPSCEQNVEVMKEQDLIIQNALEKRKEAFKGIERTVVDREIMGRNQLHPVTMMLEKKKFTKLTELILQGYTQKLFRKHHEYVDNDVQAEDYHGCNEQVDNEQMEEPPQDYQNEYQSMEEEQEFNLADLDEQENFTISEQGEEEYEEQHQSDQSSNCSEDPLSNDRTCTLKITKTESLRNAESDGTSVIQVKQEVHTRQDADVEQEDSDEVFLLRERKRKFLFEGIEIYRVNGSGKRAKLDYLQCSLCSYTLPIQKNNKNKGSSTYMKLKRHILHIHQKHYGPPKAPRVRDYKCVPCNLAFDSFKDMRDHKADHHPAVALECDVCAKPMKKGTSQKAFLNHKFSHKNDEERRASIAAEKMRSNNSIQSNQLNVGSSSSTPKTVRKRNNQRKAAQKAPRRQGRSVAKGSGTKRALEDGVAVPIVPSHVCKICDRSFVRKFSLDRHRSTVHERQSIGKRSRKKVSQKMPFIPKTES